MTRSGLPNIGLIVAVSCTAMLVAASPAAATFLGKNGRIAYTLVQLDTVGTGTSTIETISPRRGTRQRPHVLRRCVPPSPPEFDPGRYCQLADLAYSPRGKRIVFQEFAGIGGDRLAVIRAGGSAYRRLPRSAADLDHAGPRWSPGAQRLVFASRNQDETSGQYDLYSVRLDGTGLKRLTVGGGEAPDWSSRGRIAFARADPGGDPRRSNIYTTRSDGQDVRRLTYRGGLLPSWSPRGGKIAFARAVGRRPVGTPHGPRPIGESILDIFIMRSNGTGLRRLTFRGGTDPVWSPDGRKIAFLRSPDDGSRGLYTVRTDGSRLRLHALIADGFREAPFFAGFDWQPRR